MAERHSRVIMTFSDVYQVDDLLFKYPVGVGVLRISKQIRLIPARLLKVPLVLRLLKNKQTYLTRSSTHATAEY
jgi:hypothetical protein